MATADQFPKPPPLRFELTEEQAADLERAKLTPTTQRFELLGEFPEYLDPESQKRIVGIAKRASGSKVLSKDLFGRIRKRFNALRPQSKGGAKIPEEVAAHVINHWIWDPGRGHRDDSP